MKRLVLIIAVFMGVTTAIQAQPQHKSDRTRQNKSPEERAKMHADRLQQALQLTDDQKQMILELSLADMKQAQADRKENRDAFMAMKQKREEQYKEILTPDQFTKFRELQAQRREKMKERRQQGKEKAKEQAK